MNSGTTLGGSAILLKVQMPKKDGILERGHNLLTHAEANLGISSILGSPLALPSQTQVLEGQKVYNQNRIYPIPR